MPYPIHEMVEKARMAWLNWADEDCCQEASRNGDEACTEHAPLLAKYRELLAPAEDGPEYDKYERDGL